MTVRKGNTNYHDVIVNRFEQASHSFRQPVCSQSSTIMGMMHEATKAAPHGLQGDYTIAPSFDGLNVDSRSQPTPEGNQRGFILTIV